MIVLWDFKCEINLWTERENRNWFYLTVNQLPWVLVWVSSWIAQNSFLMLTRRERFKLILKRKLFFFQKKGKKWGQVDEESAFYKLTISLEISFSRTVTPFVHRKTRKSESIRDGKWGECRYGIMRNALSSIHKKDN